MVESESVSWFGLGGNLGDVPATLQRARRAIQSLGEGVLFESNLYRSAPWGLPDQPDFINQVVGIKPSLSIRETLARLQQFETEEGRTRTVKWGPRTIDIDILYWPSTRIDEPDLQVPHPRLSERRFVLLPWAELSPNLKIPGKEKTIEELLAVCSDTTWLERQSD